MSPVSVSAVTCVELRVEPDAATLLPQVEQVAAGLGDALDGLAQLRSAVAPLAAEDVAGEALAVRTDQRHAPRSGVAEREGEVLAAVDEPVEAVHARLRRVAVGEPQRQLDLRPDARGRRSHRRPQPSSNRDESA